MSSLKTLAMKEKNAAENEKKAKQTRDIIYEFMAIGEKLEVSKIARRAGVSRSFVYNKFGQLIKDEKNNRPIQSEESQQTIIQAQQLKIQALKKEITELKKLTAFKENYDKMLIENKLLKHQLEMAYRNKYS